VIFVVLAAASTAFYLRSRRTAVHPGNVNAEWTGSVAPGSAGLAATTA